METSANEKFKNCLIEELVYHLSFGNEEKFSNIELINEIGIYCFDKKDSVDKIGEKTLLGVLNDDNPACRSTAFVFLFLIEGSQKRNLDALSMFAVDEKNGNLLTPIDGAIKSFKESRQVGK